MSPRVLDAEGRELKVGDRVEMTFEDGGGSDVGVVESLYDDSFGRYAVVEFEDYFALSDIADGQFRCPDLLLADQPTKEGSRTNG